MRIAAGVLILVVALFNFFGGFAWMAAGTLANKGGGAFKEAAMQAARDPANAANAANVQQAAAMIEGKGSILQFFGIFFLILGGLAVGAGVVLFMKKALGFALAVGVLQILADALFMILAFPNLGNIIGIVAGIFVIIAVVLTKKAPAVPMGAAAPMAPMPPAR